MPFPSFSPPPPLPTTTNHLYRLPSPYKSAALTLSTLGYMVPQPSSKEAKPASTTTTNIRRYTYSIGRRDRYTKAAACERSSFSPPPPPTILSKRHQHLTYNHLQHHKEACACSKSAHISPLLHRIDRAVQSPEEDRREVWLCAIPNSIPKSVSCECYRW